MWHRSNENTQYLLTEEQLDFKYHEQIQMIRTVAQLELNAKDFSLCMQWLDVFHSSSKPEKYTRHGLLQLMQHQLITSSQLCAPFNDPTKLKCDLEDLLLESRQHVEHIKPHEDAKPVSNESPALHRQRSLLKKQTNLKLQIDTLKLRMAALQTETDHAEQKLEKLNQQKLQKIRFSQGIKANLMAAAEQTLKAQTPDAFPQHFLSAIFAVFADDKKLKDHFRQLDLELSQIMPNLCAKFYEMKKPAMTSLVMKKLTTLRERLEQKYEDELTKREQVQKLNIASMKRKCFELLRKHLENDGSYSKDFLKELECLYEQEN